MGIKKIKVILVAVLTIFIAFGSEFTMQAFAAEEIVVSGKCGENLTWKLNKEGVITISGEGEMWDFRDENGIYEYHECPWLGQRSKIKKVVFEPGITYIGADAFAGCYNLKKVSFPETLTFIGNFSFLECEDLENFTLPNSLQGIGQQAFCRCKKITKVVIPDNVTFLDAEIFGGATALTDVYIGGNKNAGGYIHSNCIFRNCTALEEIKVSPDNIALTSIDGILYGKDGRCLVQYPLGRKDKKVVLPSHTEEIMQFGIEGAAYIEEIVLPEGLTSLGPNAISDCPKLKSLTFPSTIQIVGSENGMCDNLLYIENKSNTMIELPYGRGGWIDEKGNVVTSIGKGKVYPIGFAYRVEQESDITITVGKSITVPKSIIYNGQVKESRRDLLIFSSSNPKVATVDKNGKIKAKSVGKAKITIQSRYRVPKGLGIEDNSFKTTLTLTVKKVKKNINKVKISSIKSQVYTGKAIKPKVKLKDGKKTLKLNKDYTVSYKNNKKLGKATVTIKGKGKYEGIVKKKFDIIVKKGKYYTVGSRKYKIINTSTVKFVGNKNTETTDVIIPKTVKLGGKKFKVVK